jgi:DNA-binding response OmpR family regulator
MYREFFEANGFKVTAALTPREAFDVALTADVLISDVTVRRRGDGVRLIQALRRHLETARLLIIALSVDTFETGAVHARGAGCDLFLAKPCLPDQLLTRVRSMLAWHRAGRPVLKARAPVARQSRHSG